MTYISYFETGSNLGQVSHVDILQAINKTLFIWSFLTEKPTFILSSTMQEILGKS